MLSQGARLPQFRGRSQHGEEITHADLAGASALLFFYPFAFSSVCGSELREIALRRSEFAELDARLLAISCDSPHALRAYAQELSTSAGLDAGPAGANGPEWTLLSDFWPHGEIATAFGIFDQSRGVPQRVSFFVDAAGIIRTVQSAQFHQKRDIDQTVALLRELR